MYLNTDARIPKPNYNLTLDRNPGVLFLTPTLFYRILLDKGACFPPFCLHSP